MSDEQEIHQRKVKEIIVALERAGIKQMTHDDLAKLLPDNPEWARYMPRRRKS